MKKRLLLCLLPALFFSCSTGQNGSDSTPVDEPVTTVKIPDGAVPIVYRRHLYIACQVDSAEANLIFDTGANNLYLDSTFFSQAELQYENLAQAQLPGAGNGMQHVPLILDTVTCSVFGDLYQTRYVPIFQLKPILGDYADGIIGLDHYDGKVLQISYQDQYFKVCDDVQEADVTGYSKVEMRRSENRLFVPASIQVDEDLTLEGELLLDLGSAGSITLTSAAASKYKLGQQIRDKVRFFTIAGGVGGASSSYVFRATEAKVSDFTFEEPILSFSLDTAGALSRSTHMGLIGNEILDRFDLMIDFNNSVLYLKPNDRLNHPFSLSRHGFSFVDRSSTLGGWIVKGFYEDCDAWQKGLRPKDKIIAVDGLPVNQISYEQQRELFKTRDQIELAVKRGEEDHSFTIDLTEQEL